MRVIAPRPRGIVAESGRQPETGTGESVDRYRVHASDVADAGGPGVGQRTHPPSGNTTSEVNQSRCPQVARATWNLLVAGVRDAGSVGFAEVAGTDREKTWTAHVITSGIVSCGSGARPFVRSSIRPIRSASHFGHCHPAIKSRTASSSLAPMTGVAPSCTRGRARAVAPARSYLLRVQVVIAALRRVFVMVSSRRGFVEAFG